MSDQSYLETISLVERLHRHFLEVVKLEIDGLASTISTVGKR
jgi:hypothetical protein